MFIGHFAVGFASRRWVPGAGLGPLIAAVQLPDLLWPIFVLAGWEEVRVNPGDTAFTPLTFVSYPISHSLVTVMGWAAVYAALYWRATRHRPGAVAMFAGVVSHWVLDWITHRPDLPLYPGGPTTGLGLWNSVPGTLTVEGGLFAAALWLYPGPRGWRFWTLIGLLLGIYAGAVFGPPPPSGRAVALTDLAAWLLPLWGWWIDRTPTAV